MLSYILLVGLPVLGLFVVLRVGQSLPSPVGLAAEPAAIEKVGSVFNLPLLLLQVIVVVIVARLAGRALASLGQPRVIGEMAAGLMLGPSLLGAVAPAISAALFPSASLGFLSALSQIGLIFFMFLVGLELDPAHLRERARTALLTSHSSIVLPFLAGAILALYLYPRLAPAGVNFAGFAMFVGAAMSVTAFPVLARILVERSLTRTRLGTIAIACAAIDDITAWCILAGIVILVRGSRASTPLWMTIGGTIAYVAFMATVGRKTLERLTSWRAPSSRRCGARSTSCRGARCPRTPGPRSRSRAPRGSAR